MKFFLIFFLAISLSSVAQTAEQDSSGFEATMQWLERKLTYNYFDPTNQQWWVNVIQKKENGAYTIKNIAAKHPEHVTEKVYHQRTFYLWDLNPKTITVSEVPNNLGRFIQGNLVRLEGFKGENKIATMKDGRVGSKVSYIHISIPKFLEDSLQGYAIEVKEKLSAALYLNARLFNTNDLEKNVKATFDTFRGNYLSEDSTTYLDFEVVGDRLARFKIRDESQTRVGTIGYDEDIERVYYFLASTDDHFISLFEFDSMARNIVLKSEKNRINILGRNTIEFLIDGNSTKFFRY